MRVMFIGDPCSGKTSVLEQLERGGQRVMFEDGWKRIPPEIEKNKFQSNLWFSRYFYEREKNIPLNGDIFIERSLYYQYPLSQAQVKTGKINETEYQEIIALLNALTKDMPPLSSYVVIDFRCSLEQLSERLKLTRERVQSPAQMAYWRVLREAVERYFQSCQAYYQLPVADSSIEDICQNVRSVLSSHGYTG